MATALTKSYLAIDALTNYVQRESWQIRDIHEGLQEADTGGFATEDQVKAKFVALAFVPAGLARPQGLPPL